MMNLFGAVHTCPALTHLHLIAYMIARLTSPSSSKTKASLPPSSITAFLRCFPATSAMEAPDLDDPVKLTPEIRGDFKIVSS